MPSHVPSRIGRYRILALIRRGRPGWLSRGRDELRGGDIWLKVLDPTEAVNPAARARFVEEARITAAFNRPSIISVKELGESEGILFMVCGVIIRPLQKNPEDRYPDAGAMRADLDLAPKELGDGADWRPQPSQQANHN